MAASITNSNETVDSITAALLIHEVGLSRHRLLPPTSLLSEVSAFTCPSFSFPLIYPRPSPPSPPLFRCHIEGGGTWFHLRMPDVWTGPLFLYIYNSAGTRWGYFWTCRDNGGIMSRCFEGVSIYSLRWTTKVAYTTDVVVQLLSMTLIKSERLQNADLCHKEKF